MWFNIVCCKIQCISLVAMIIQCQYLGDDLKIGVLYNTKQEIQGQRAKAKMAAKEKEGKRSSVLYWTVHFLWYVENGLCLCFMVVIQTVPSASSLSSCPFSPVLSLSPSVSSGVMDG